MEIKQPKIIIQSQPKMIEVSEEWAGAIFEANRNNWTRLWEVKNMLLHDRDDDGDATLSASRVITLLKRLDDCLSDMAPIDRSSHPVESRTIDSSRMPIIGRPPKVEKGGLPDGIKSVHIEKVESPGPISHHATIVDNLNRKYEKAFLALAINPTVQWIVSDFKTKPHDGWVQTEGDDR